LEIFFRRMKMDWRDCRYFWNPKTGFVLVAQRGDPSPAREVATMWMDGYEKRTTTLMPNHPAIVSKVFVEFNTLTVRDRIPIDAAHREFLKVKQYRTHIAPDIEGATEAADDSPAKVW
jgi:hypothetical protein